MKRDLLGLRDLDKHRIMYILETARDMKIMIDNPQKREDILKNFYILTLFYENSTRTKSSFLLAGKYLGATVLDLVVATSSVSKGENLIDTGVTLNQMGADAIVMRHSSSGASHLLARNVTCSVINAGDGINEHPTQGLLDIFTIYEHKGSFEGLKVAIVGDINHSRVARSNAFGLTKLGAKVILAGPPTLVSSAKEKLGVETTSNISEALSEADVVMVLRVQLERQKKGSFPDFVEYSSMYGIGKQLLKYARKDALVMHPGPVNRGIEIDSEVVNSKNSVINIQVKNGVAVRMAVLKMLKDKF